jgi:hypothetical protein
VRKTSVYLSEPEAIRLAELARQEGISQADVIRRAIRQCIPQQRGARHFPSATALMALGVDHRHPG